MEKESKEQGNSANLPKYSKYGIASFMVFIIYISIDVAVSSLELIYYPNYSISNSSFYLTISLLISIIGTILGIIGIRQKSERMIYSKLGLGLNGFFTFISVILPILSIFF